MNLSILKEIFCSDSMDQQNKNNCKFKSDSAEFITFQICPNYVNIILNCICVYIVYKHVCPVQDILMLQKCMFKL